MSIMYDPGNPGFGMELVTDEDGVKRLRLTPRKRTPYDYLTMEEREERQCQLEEMAGEELEELVSPVEVDKSHKGTNESPRPEPKPGVLPYGFYGEKYKKEVPR